MKSQCENKRSQNKQWEVSYWSSAHWLLLIDEHWLFQLKKGWIGRFYCYNRPANWTFIRGIVVIYLNESIIGSLHLSLRGLIALTRRIRCWAWWMDALVENVVCSTLITLIDSSFADLPRPINWRDHSNASTNWQTADHFTFNWLLQLLFD